MWMRWNKLLMSVTYIAIFLGCLLIETRNNLVSLLLGTVMCDVCDTGYAFIRTICKYCIFHSRMHLFVFVHVGFSTKTHGMQQH